MQTVRRYGVLGRYFSDNFQVRALSGETDRLPFPILNNNCSSYYEGKKKSSECKGKEGQFPCGYGGKFGGGTPANHNVTEVALERAKRVLEQFDIVLPKETLTEQAEFLADVLSVPLENASIATTKLNVMRGNNDFTVSDMEIRIPETLELLKRHSKFEMLLYDHALEINRRLLKRWEHEKSTRMG